MPERPDSAGQQSGVGSRDTLGQFGEEQSSPAGFLSSRHDEIEHQPYGEDIGEGYPWPGRDTKIHIRNVSPAGRIGRTEPQRGRDHIRWSHYDQWQQRCEYEIPETSEVPADPADRASRDQQCRDCAERRETHYQGDQAPCVANSFKRNYPR